MHVLDASRAVGVVGSLKKSRSFAAAFADENRREQARLVKQHHSPQAAPLLTLEDARHRRPPFDWSAYAPPVPAFTGVRVSESVPLEALVPLIDWTPFFHAWELKGVYPRLLHL